MTDQRRSDPDLERVDAPVKQADCHIPTQVVGTEDVPATRVPELRPDRNPSGDEHPVDEAAFRDDLNLLAIAGEGLAEVPLVRPRMRDVVGVDRREGADDDDDDEQEEEREGDVVPAQPPPCEQPGALALDYPVLSSGELGGGVEREIGRGFCRHAAFFPLER